MSVAGPRRLPAPDSRRSSVARWAVEGLALLVILSVAMVVPAALAPAGRAALIDAGPTLPGSLGFAAIAAAVAVVVGWPIGRLGGAAVVLALLPLVLPAALHAAGWRAIVGSAEILGRPWSIASPWIAAPITGLRVAGVVAVLAWLTPRRDPADDPMHRLMPVRHPRWNLQWRPTLPVLLAAAALAGLLVVGDHVTPGLLLVSTWGTQILLQHAALLDSVGAAALGAPLLGLAAIGALLVVRTTDPDGPGDGGPSRPSPDAGPGRDRRPDGRPVTAARPARVGLRHGLALLPAGPPIVALFLVLDGPGSLEEAIRTMGPELWRSAGPAMLAAALATAGGWGFASAWRRARRFGRPTLVPAAIATVAVPAAVPGLSLLAWLSGGPAAGLLDGTGPLIVVWAIRATPLAAIIMMVARVGADDDMAVDVARPQFGVGTIPAWRYLVLPARGPAAIAAFVVTGLVCMADAETAVLLAPPGFTTAGVRLSTLVHTAPQSLVAASALVAAVGGLFGAAVVALMLAAAIRLLGGPIASTNLGGAP